ncbi:hypothetical protein CRE_01271 [Caenorhabditis remanei]|uniref:Uncharacterized protein n=1 Tax=Caenorhabditis remanei TaxID=31234 RepID=E3N9P7_CAERE|nr:hypothetical protein CRE_01271 [Caenorhabditis remanei]
MEKVLSRENLREGSIRCRGTPRSANTSPSAFRKTPSESTIEESKIQKLAQALMVMNVIDELHTKNNMTATKEIEDLKVKVDRKNQKILRLKESEMDLKEKLMKAENDKKELLYAKDQQILELQGQLLKAIRDMDGVHKAFEKCVERSIKLETENLELKARLVKNRPIKLGELRAELIANARSHMVIKDFEVSREFLEAML